MRLPVHAPRRFKIVLSHPPCIGQRDRRGAAAAGSRSRRAALLAVLFGCGSALAAPLQVRVTGGFTQSFTVTFSGGVRDEATVSASVDLTFSPSAPACQTTYLSSSSALVTGTIRVWGTATRYTPPSSTLTRNFDDTWNWQGVSASPDVLAYEGETGNGDVLDMDWWIRSTVDAAKATPYAIRYDGAAGQLRLWVALPHPFWYNEDDEFYDADAVAAVTGQESVKSCLHGTVVDGVQEPVAGAQILFGNVPNTSDAAGAFHYINIPANPYQLIVSKSGYNAVTNVVSIPAFRIVHTNVVLRGPRELQGIEITQCVQNWNNDVPLVAGKRAYLVAHVWSTEPSDTRPPGMPLTVRLSSGGITRTIQRTILNVPYRSDPSRPPDGYVREKDDSIVIPIDADLCGGILTATLEADGLRPKPGFAGTVDANGYPMVAVFFQPMPTLKIRPVLFKWWDSNGVAHVPDLASMNRAIAVLKETVPARDVTLDLWRFPLWETVPVSDAGVFGKPMTTNDLIRLCEFMRLKQGAGGKDVFYLGLLAGFYAGEPTTCAGVAARAGPGATLGRVATAYIPSTPRSTDWLIVRHEIAHNLGRTDAANDASFPRRADGKSYVSQNSDENASDTFFGLDNLSLFPRRIVSRDFADLMCYEDNKWPSGHTYTREFEYIQSFVSASLSAATFAPQSEPLSESLGVFVAGECRTDTMYGKVAGVRVVNADGEASSGSGEWSLTLEDAAGNALESVDFSPLFYDGDDLRGFFQLRLRWNAAAKRVVLRRGGTILDTVVRSAHAPQVTLLSPQGVACNGDPIRVTWQGSDADGDRLTYDVELSIDGGVRWSTLAIGRTNLYADIESACLPGTAQALFRVVACDGFNTASDQSDSACSLPTKAPFVTIVTPRDRSAHGGSADIQFLAMAADPQAGEIGPSNIVWRSSRDGVIGTGDVVRVSAALLSEGDHTITVDAVGKAGLHATQSVAITVFRDMDMNGMPDWWEMLYFGSPFGTDADADSDGDGLSNLAEFLCGTHPKNPASCLRLNRAELLPSAGFHLQWDAVAGKSYRVFWNEAPRASWTERHSLLVGSTNRWLDVKANGAASRFYRVGLEID